jgi:hypothetical protein
MRDATTMTANRQALEATLGALETHGLLLLSDSSLPSVVRVITGEPLHKSWWGHPLGGVIYHVLTTLEDEPDVLATKLINGKVTFIHRRLRPAVFAVATAREPWQLTALTPVAQWLLAQLDVEGLVRTNDLSIPAHIKLERRRLPEAARDLERRLLVYATEIHGASGAHAKVLETWSHWARREGNVSVETVSAAEGKHMLEDAATRLGGAILPWRVPPRKTQLERAGGPKAR